MRSFEVITAGGFVKRDFECMIFTHKELLLVPNGVKLI